MNDESKKNNILKSDSQINSKENKDISTSDINANDRKNEGCNDWTSVPKTYDKEESCCKHEKTATDNQWCSTNK